MPRQRFSGQVNDTTKAISAKLPAGGQPGCLTITPQVTIKTITIVGDRLGITYQ